MVCGGVSSAVPLEQVCSSLAALAPLRLSEDWDNTGLLVGDRKADVSRVMTCLTITPDVVEEAIESKVNLIVTHHPLPFKPLAKINSDSITGSMLLRLISARIAVYSAHTAFDSSAQGINQSWADKLGLQSCQPLIGLPDSGNSDPGTSAGASSSSEGSGRCGRLVEPIALAELVRRADAVASGSLISRQDEAALSTTRWVGEPDRMVRKIGVACGSGGSFLAAAKRRGCDALITGEATFHTCLEARSIEIGLVLVGHFGSECFAMESLASQLSNEIDGIEVWASRRETDPIRLIASL